MEPLRARVGVDIGGTFTDFVLFRPDRGTVETFKLLSTPPDPAQAVLQGLAAIRERLAGVGMPVEEVIHGSTVATNALLERKGASTALVATRGFGDLLQIGRQNRPELYDLFADPAPPLVPDGLRLEVGERVSAEGEILAPLAPAEVEALVPALQAGGAASVAVCLLFSFLRPEHEQQIAARLRQAGFLVSLSSEILPEFREYERASTTAVNAYVSPALDRYLVSLQRSLGAPGASAPESPRLRVMQSNGGNISLEEARRNGVRCILSGPAGGVIGSHYLFRQAWQSRGVTNASALPPARLITFDMGGTSTDVALIDGEPRLTTEAVVGGCPIGVPLLDIHTIGAGGGSIAGADAGGALRVGPHSAGADPGPACYGRGNLPTVTDANLVLGRLAGEYFLGGQMPLDDRRAYRALEALGQELGLDPVQAALGIVAVANAHMERALRVISVERGYDPRDFTLLSFGGAGGLHAADLARRLGIPRLLVPPLASTLSAFGMLAADVVKDYAQTVMLPGDTPPAGVAARLAPLAERGARELAQEGIAPDRVRLESFLDLRYRGQSFELTVPFGEAFMAGFHALHRRFYGYDRPQAPVEIVNLRLRATGQIDPPRLPALPPAGPDPAEALLERRRIVLDRGRPQEVPFYRGEALRPGHLLAGPAVVARADTTILLGPADRAEVDPLGDLWISIGGAA